MNKTFEVDELRTFIGKKENKFWVVCAFERETKRVVDFRVGRRTKRTLRFVTDTLLLTHARKIYTDGLKLYEFIIPKIIHKKSAFMINHIERMNLNIRTHLKRLNRRTICFTKNSLMLEACLKIYFWS
jgi:IS1 family transposase